VLDVDQCLHSVGNLGQTFIISKSKLRSFVDLGLVLRNDHRYGFAI
jgi:hypothetical protein